MDIISGTELLKFFLSLVFVLALMGGLSLLLKRFGQGRHALPPKKRRLKIIEMLPLDSKRRLVIIERDDKQHLVLLGANNETVIEGGFEAKETTETGETESV